MKKDVEDITPEDSVVPVYLEPWTEEKLAEIAETNKVFEAEQKARDKVRNSALKKLEKLGLTVEEIQAIMGQN